MKVNVEAIVHVWYQTCNMFWSNISMSYALLIGYIYAHVHFPPPNRLQDVTENKWMTFIYYPITVVSKINQSITHIYLSLGLKHKYVYIYKFNGMYVGCICFLVSCFTLAHFVHFQLHGSIRKQNSHILLQSTDIKFLSF